MDILSFCLGAVAALVLALLVISVVMVFRLNKRVSVNSSNIENMDHVIGTLDTDLRRTIDDSEAVCRSYVDSRIDKLSNK